MSGKPAPKSRSNYALFLGDLSIFCTEKDIEDAFQQYGEIVNIRIQRSKETARALSYGFIEFSCETAAVTAMNELNGFVLKGRPLRIRWAAKRNQPVKSENTALQTAATIFVKFASQTGIIVTEEVLREHFTAYGKVLDTTIRTITIDEAFNRSKGYGFVNFVNNAEEDGLAAAYRASAELQNTTINGVNYRCEVGYKHQPQAQGHGPAGHHGHAGVHGGSSHSLNSAPLGKTDSDSVSASMAGLSLNTSGNVSANASHASMPHPGASQGQGNTRAFLPSLSPTKAQYGYSNSSVTSAAAASHSPAHSRSHSHSSSGPPSPHPAAGPYFTVNPQVLSSGASVISQGSGGSGMYSTNSPYAPHSPHGHHIVSAIPYVPGAAVPVYTQQSAQSVASQQGVYVSAPGQQQPYYSAQPGQQGYYVQPPAQGYYGAPGYAPQQVPAATYYGSGHSQQGSFYAPSSTASQDGYYSAAPPAQEGYAPQYYAAGQGYYHGSGAPVPMAPATSPRPSTVFDGALHAATTGAGPQPHGRARRPGMVPHQMHHAPPVGMMYVQAPMPVPEVVEGRRSQRNISNKSNISEITSATLNELQYDDDDEIDDEEVPQPPSANPTVATAAPHTAAVAAPNVFVGGRGNGYSRVTAPASVPDATTEIAGAGPPPRHLKSTLQTLPGTTTPPTTINCKLTARRGRRSATGGSNTTEITAEMLYDLQQQEQRLAKEEEEEGFMEPPTTRTPQQVTPTPITEEDDLPPAVCGQAAPAVTTASARLLTNTPETPEPERESTPIDPDATPLATAVGMSPVSVIKMLRTPPTHPTHRRRPSSGEEEITPAKSISPFTLTADALEQLHKDAEAQDSASGKVPQRRTKRNVSDRSNASDITAALAYMQLEYSEDHFKSLDDDGESYSSASASACVCGKGASSCPFGTTACSCVYSATC